MSTVTLPRAAAKVRRIDFRVVVGLLLFTVGILATRGIIRQANERTPVLVATRSIQPGETLGSGDVRVAEIGLASGVASVGADEADAIIGTVVRSRIEAGQILSPETVASGPALNAGEVAISVGVLPAHAVGGSLAPGDRVMVLATDNPDRPVSATRVLLSEVEVIAVDRTEGPGAQPEITVILAVSENDAAAVAEAANSGVVDLVLLPGGSP